MASIRQSPVLGPAAAFGGRDRENLLNHLRSERLLPQLLEAPFYEIAHLQNPGLCRSQTFDGGAGRAKPHGALQFLTKDRFDQADRLSGSLAATSGQALGRKKCDRSRCRHVGRIQILICSRCCVHSFIILRRWRRAQMPLAFRRSRAVGPMAEKRAVDNWYVRTPCNPCQWGLRTQDRERPVRANRPVLRRV